MEFFKWQTEKRLFWTNNNTLVKGSKIYIGRYTFPILLLNDYNMLGEHIGRGKNIVYGRLFQKIHILYLDGHKSWIWWTLGHAVNIFIKLNFHSASNKGIYLQKNSKSLQWFKSTMQWLNIAELAIFKVARFHQCMELKNVFF